MEVGTIEVCYFEFKGEVGIMAVESGAVFMILKPSPLGRVAQVRSCTNVPLSGEVTERCEPQKLQQFIDRPLTENLYQLISTLSPRRQSRDLQLYIRFV